MHRIHTVFAAPDVNMRSLEKNLLPPETDQLADPEVMVVGREDHRRVTLRIAPMLSRRLDQNIDFDSDQKRHNIAVYDAW